MTASLIQILRRPFQRPFSHRAHREKDRMRGCELRSWHTRVTAALLILFILLPPPRAALADPLKLRIASEGTNPPFSTINSSGKLEGFDIDIANALCAQMHADCEIVAQDWDGIIPALIARKYDAIAASMNITADRAKVVAFTNPYYHSPSVFIVRKGTDTKDLSPTALAGKTIGVQSSTNHAAFLDDKYPRSTVRLYNTSADAYRDLAAARIDYVLYDKLPAYDWLRTPDGACCELAPGDMSDPAYFGSGIGIALRKDDADLLKQFNAAIEGIVADGVYAKINAKYFPFPIF
jgi:lysine-arginine-ornithine-binding protein